MRVVSSYRCTVRNFRSCYAEKAAFAALAVRLAVIPSESRGIPLRNLKGNMAGSLDCARDEKQSRPSGLLLWCQRTNDVLDPRIAA